MHKNHPQILQHHDPREQLNTEHPLWQPHSPEAEPIPARVVAVHHDTTVWDARCERAASESMRC